MNMYNGYNQTVKTPEGIGREISRMTTGKITMVTVMYANGRARVWPIDLVEVVTENAAPVAAAVTTEAVAS